MLIADQLQKCDSDMGDVGIKIRKIADIICVRAPLWEALPRRSTTLALSRDRRRLCSHALKSHAYFCVNLSKSKRHEVVH